MIEVHSSCYAARASLRLELASATISPRSQNGGASLCSWDLGFVAQVRLGSGSLQDKTRRDQGPEDHRSGMIRDSRDSGKKGIKDWEPRLFRSLRFSSSAGLGLAVQRSASRVQNLTTFYVRRQASARVCLGLNEIRTQESLLL